MRKLNESELKRVTGGSGCHAPTTGHKGNPGNYKPVGNAGEKGGKFTTGFATINGNGRAGASAA